MDEQLLQEFLAEAEDLIEVLFGDIKALRARHREGRARRELVGRIFRHIHTIKGSAAAAGLTATSELAHEFESLLDAVRMGRVPTVDDTVLDAFEDAVAAIAEGLQAVAQGEPEASKASSALVGRLRALSADAPPPSPPPIAPNPKDESFSRALAALPEDIRHILSEYESHRLREAVGEGARLFVVKVDFGLDNFDEQFRNLSDALAEGGEIVSTLPGMEAGAFDRVNFRILYAAPETSARVVARISPFGAVLVETTSETGETRAGEMNASEEKIDDESQAHETTTTLSSLAAPLPMLVRVPLDVLDEIISSMHELFTDTVATLEVGVALARTEKAEMETRAARIRRRFFELEEGLINLRMVALDRTLERAVRAGRSVARAAGKDVDFEIAGGEVRVDKSLADAITDPLLHLLRNAIDHGIESSVERRSAGKDARGRISIEARAESNRVSLRVTDDGRGLDMEAIARAAAEQGLVAHGERPTEQQSLRLIFRPGFTTARELSSVSGRGVGLEVVEHAVEQFGGELRVSSRQGRGTTFEMRLPTTLALVPALIVHSAGRSYCVDARHVIEAGHIAPREMREEPDGAPVVRWRGARLPLVRMRELLGQDEGQRERMVERTESDGAQTATPAPDQLPFIISRIARPKTDAKENGETEHAAVLVDGLEGEGEVLVRTLGRHATRWRGVSGATELRDGTVALMLDLPRLLEMRL